MINEIIKAAEATIVSRDPALINWARRNVGCALEDMGEMLRVWHRRTHSRFSLTKAEAIEWELENLQSYLDQQAIFADMLDRIEVAGDE